MPLITRLFVRDNKLACLPKVPSDEVYPLHFFDDQKVYHNSHGVWLLRFNDVLDPTIVHSAFERLCSLPGWRKCGGRLRMNEHNKLEVHVPEKFTSARPASMLTRVAYGDISINEHPVASCLPRETAIPSMQTSPVDLLSLSMTPRTPTCLEDYLKSDMPMLNMHIVSFKDATLVSMTWPHVLGDIMSASAICEAWSLMMAGRESEVPAFLSAGHDDILDNAGRHRGFNDKHMLDGKQLTGFWFLLWVARYFWDILMWYKMETHSVFLPARAVIKLKAKAMMEIKIQNPDAKPSVASHASSYVSTADVIFAWIICQMGRATFSPRTRRSVMIGFPCDVRDRAPSIFPPAQKPQKKDKDGAGGSPGGVWVQNASPPILQTVPARDVVHEHGVARVAQSIRHAITTLGTESQIHAQYALARDSYNRTGLPPIFGTSDQFPINGTNWTKANFFEKVDFSPAVVQANGAVAAAGDKAGKKTKDAGSNGNSSGNSNGTRHARKSAVGKPVYLHANEVFPPGSRQPLSRNIAYLVGTPSGGYWVVGKFHPAVWRQVEGALAALQ